MEMRMEHEKIYTSIDSYQSGWVAESKHLTNVVSLSSRSYNHLIA